jgi:hypothetical protein
VAVQEPDSLSRQHRHSRQEFQQRDGTDSTKKG